MPINEIILTLCPDDINEYGKITIHSITESSLKDVPEEEGASKKEITLKERHHILSSVTKLCIGNEFEDLIDLTTFPNDLMTLMPKLRSVAISGCNSIEAIPKLGDNIMEQEISFHFDEHDKGNVQTKIITGWPDFLESLILDISSLTTIPEAFPESLKALSITNLNNDLAIPDLPDTLNDLTLSNPNRVPDVLPSGLKELYICSPIEKLTSFNHANLNDLEKLELIDCCDLESINLESLSSEKLTKVDLRGCVKLEETDELVKRLQEIANGPAENSQVFYPEHFFDKENPWKKELRNILNNALDEINIKRKDSKMKSLFLRYSNELLDKRNTQEVERYASIVINLVKIDPRHLLWMEEVASGYIDECINQPVAGWFELCGYANLLNKKTMTEKIEASKQIAVQYYLTGYLADFLRTGGLKGHGEIEGVQVELGNLLTRKLQEKMLDGDLITEPWSGVESFTANEGCVSDVLSNTTILQDAFNFLEKTVFNTSNEEFIKVMLESKNSEAWMDIITHGTGILNEAGKYLNEKRVTLKERQENLMEEKDFDKIGSIATEIKELEIEIESITSSNKRETAAKYINDKLLEELLESNNATAIDNPDLGFSRGVADMGDWGTLDNLDLDASSNATKDERGLLVAVGAVAANTAYKCGHVDLAASSGPYEHDGTDLAGNSGAAATGEWDILDDPKPIDKESPKNALDESDQLKLDLETAAEQAANAQTRPGEASPPKRPSTPTKGPSSPQVEPSRARRPRMDFHPT